MNMQLVTAETVPEPVMGRVAPTRTRVLGSDALSREGVVGFLQDSPEIRVLPDAVSGPADVVVVVLDRVSDGAMKLVRTLGDDVAKVVLVVADLDVARVADLVQAGVVGIVRRSEVTRSGLRQVIRTVLAGDAVVPPDLLGSLLGRELGRLPGKGVRRMTLVALNDREVRVLTLLSEGSDTREIASRLSYSERTVKTIIQDITHRFGLRNRSHAVAYALRHELI